MARLSRLRRDGACSLLLKWGLIESSTRQHPLVEGVMDEIQTLEENCESREASW